MSSGRLMRSGSLALKRAPETAPAATSAVAPAQSAPEARASAETKVVPISIANEQSQEVAHTLPQTISPPQTARPEAVAPVSLAVRGKTAEAAAGIAATSPSSASRSLAPVEAVAPLAEVSAAAEDLGGVQETAATSELTLEPEATNAPAGYLKKRDPAAKKTWDVQLLYMLFPELDPSYRPEFQAPVVDFTKDVMQRDQDKPSRKIQILSWFYPTLGLDSVHERQREHRRAPRITDPGLVGFYFSGGHSQPHQIRNLSVMGFFMVTNERWLPGTVIRITLQIIGSAGDDPRDTLTVLSRVVNWGPDGGGFEFVMPGFVD